MKELGLGTLAAIVGALTKAGWLRNAATPLDNVQALQNGKLDVVLSAYKTFYALPDDQSAIAHLLTPRFCGRPDVERIASGSGGPLIPSKEVRWYATSFNLPGLTWDQFAAEVDDSWNRLARVCGITVRNVANPNDANTIIDCGDIDGEFGTLAWSELANGDPHMIAHQMYDAGDSWRKAPGVLQPSKQLDIGRVLDHENMHRLGLPHDTRNLGALLDPIYSLSVDRATNWDIERLQAIYGPPVSTSAPTGGALPPPVVPTVPTGGPIPADLGKRLNAFATEAIVEQRVHGVVITLPNMNATAHPNPQ